MARVRAGEIFYDIGIDRQTLDAAMRALTALAQVGNATRRAFAGGNPVLMAYNRQLEMLSDGVKAAEANFKRGGSAADYANALAHARREAERLQVTIQGLGAPVIDNDVDRAAQMKLIAKSATIAATSMDKLLDRDYKPFDDRIQRITSEMKELQAAFAEGKVDEATFAAGMQRLTQESRDVTTALNAQDRSLRRMTATGAEATQAQLRFNETQAKAAKLASQAARASEPGRVAVAGFAREVTNLNKRIEDAEDQYKRNQMSIADYARALEDARIEAQRLRNETENIGTTMPGSIVTDDDRAEQLKVTASAADAATAATQRLLNLSFEQYDNEIAAIASEMDKLDQKFKAGDISSAQFEAEMAKLGDRSRKLEANLEANAAALSKTAVGGVEAAAATQKFADAQASAIALTARANNIAGVNRAAIAGSTAANDKLSLTMREQGGIVDGLVQQIRQLASAMKVGAGDAAKNAKDMQDLQEALKVAKAAYDSLTKGLTLNAAEHKKRTNVLFNAARGDDVATAALARHTKALQAQNLANILTQGSMTLLTDKIFQASPTLGIFTNSLIYSTQGLRAFLAAALPVVAVAGSIIAIVATLSASLRSAVGLENALANVRKTTGLTSDELKEMTRTFQGVSKEIPISTLELVEMARVAGQLGIKGRENLERFSVAVSKLAIATDVTGEEGATAFARYLQAIGTEADKMGFAAEQLGNVMNALENSTAATAREILDMTSYTAGLASQSRATADEILAINAALLALGVQQEAGGSAVVRILADVQAATTEAGDRLRTFAKYADMTAGEFEALVKTSPVQALEALAKGMNQAAADGLSLSNVMTELGIMEVRERRTLSALAQGVDVYSGALETARREVFLMKSLEDEVAIQRDKTTSKVKLLGARFSELKQNIGNELLPTVHVLLDALIFLSDNLVTVATAVGSLVLVLGRKALGSAIVFAVSNIRKLTFALGSLVATNLPLLALSTAITGVVYVLSRLNRETRITTTNIDQMTSSLDEAVSTFTRVRGIQDINDLITGRMSQIRNNELIGSEEDRSEFANQFFTLTREIVTQLENIAEPTAKDIGDATAKVFQYWSVTTIRAMQRSLGQYNEDFRNALDRLDIPVDFGGAQYGDAAFVALSNEIEAFLASMRLDPSIFIEFVTRAQQDQSEIDRLRAEYSTMSQALFDGLIAMAKDDSQVMTNLRIAASDAARNVVATTQGLASLRDSIASMTQDVSSLIQQALTPVVETPAGLTEVNEVLATMNEAIREISIKAETLLNETDRAITPLEAARQAYETYVNALVGLQTILTTMSKQLSPDMVRMIESEQARIRGLLPGLAALIEAAGGEKPDPSDVDKIKEITEMLDEVISEYNAAANSLRESQTLARALGEEVMSQAELAAAEQDLIREALQKFFEVDSAFWNRANENFSINFDRFARFVEDGMELYGDMANLIPDFINMVVDRMNEANAAADREFNRLIDPTDEDRLALMQEKMENQMNLIRELDDEIARLQAITPEPGEEVAHNNRIALLQIIADDFFRVYRDMARAAEEFGASLEELDDSYYENAAVQAAMQAGAEDLAEAIKAVSEAGFTLNNKVLAALRENFPEVSARVQAVEGAMKSFYEALGDINLREELGLIDEYDALSQKLSAAETRLLEVSKAMGENSIEFELAARQVRLYREAVDAAIVTKAFDDMNQAIRITERNLRVGLIEAEDALQAKIQARQTLINNLSQDEKMNAVELRAQLQLLIEDQAELNRLVEQRTYGEAQRDFAEGMKEIDAAVSAGLIDRQTELNDRMAVLDTLIQAASTRFGNYSGIVMRLRAELKLLSDEYDTLTGEVQAYDEAVQASAEAQLEAKRQLGLGVIDEIGAAQMLLAAKEAELETALKNQDVNSETVRQLVNERNALQKIVDTLTERQSLSEAVLDAEQEYGRVVDQTNTLIARGLMTRQEALEAQASALENIANAKMAEDGLTAQVIDLLTQVELLRAEAERLNEEGDLAQAAKEFADAMAAVNENFAAGKLTAIDAVTQKVALMRAEADRLQEVANGRVTPAIAALREQADLLEKSLQQPIDSLSRLANAFDAVAAATGGFISNLAKVGSSIIDEVKAIEEGIKALGEATTDVEKDEAWSGIYSAIAGIGNALSSLVPRVESVTANILDSFVAVFALIAESATPGLGQAIAAIGGLFISLLGDMSNGIKQVREQIEGLAASSQYLSAETIAAFTKITVKIGDELLKVTEKVSRGGLLGLLGFKKDQLNKEAMDFVMSIAEGLSNGFANAMTQAVQTGVAGGDWRQAFRDAFKTTVLNAIINTFVTATLLAQDFAEFIEKLTIAIATGNLEEVNRLINEELPVIIANGEAQVDEFIGSVPDELKTYGDNLTSGIRGAFAAALKGAFLGEKDWRMKFRNAFKETILNALIDALVAGAIMATKFQDFIGRLVKAIADGNIDEAKRMMREELPAILDYGEGMVDDMVGSIPEELRPESNDVDQTLSSGLSSAFGSAIDGAFKGEPDWGKKLKENVRQALIDSIKNAIVEALMASDEITKFMEEFTRILKEEGPEAAAKYAKDNFDRVVDAGTAGAVRAGEILSDTFGKTSEEITQDFVDATMQANDFMTESLARTIAFLSTINGVIDEATSDMMITIAEKISSGFESGFRNGINAMLAGDEDWRDKLADDIRNTILQSLIDSFIASAAISTIAADFTEGFLRAMQDPNVDAAQWAKDNIGTAIDGMATLIETFVSSIPDELLPSSNPRSPRYKRPDRNERDSDSPANQPRQAGTNISEITGPTRDLLIDLLRPLSILPSWTSMIRDIRNDVRAIATGGIVTPMSLPGVTGQPVAAGAGIVNNISIQNLTVQTQASNAREFYNDLSKIAYRDRRGGK